MRHRVTLGVLRLAAAMACAPPPGRDRLVALYAYNFGNYRNEFGQYKGGASVRLPDYRGWRNRFVFSEASEKTPRGLLAMVTDGWIHCALRDTRDGWTLTKYLKFGALPKVLRAYKYVLHLDLSLFRHQAGSRRNPGIGYAWSRYALPDHADIVRAVRAEPGVALFLTRHPYRSRTTVEWRSTHASQHEPRFAPLCRFEEAATRRFGAKSVAACPLYAMGQFLRRVGACVEIKILRRVRAVHRIVLHAINATPARWRRIMAWRCRFLTARPSQDGHVIAEK